MADYPIVEDPFNVDEAGRDWCAICQTEMYRDESRTDTAMICSEYCRGRYDERRAASRWASPQ